LIPLCLLVASLTGAAEAPADLLLEGGTVYASAEAVPVRASVVAAGGRIVFVGDPAAARARAAGARVVNLEGAFVFPGFADAHLHLLGVGKSLEVADLKGATASAEAARRMAKAAEALPPGRWVEGRGWDQNLWPGRQFPRTDDLDRAVPDRPAIARRVDGHAIWVNSVALRTAGVGASTPDPEGGRILRRPDGTPSGVLVDNATTLVEAAMPPETAADLRRRLLAGARACAAAGLTEVQDASAYEADVIAALAAFSDRRELPLRVYATVSSAPASLEAFLAAGKRIGSGSDFLTVRAIKAYADGALGSRGAALLEDYADEPGRRGLLVTPPERLTSIATEARRHGWQLWIHAIGDRGNRVALDAFERAARDVPDPAAGGERPRIEHAQVVAPTDFPRFAHDGVIASIQPTHATSDMPWALDRLGSARLEGAYAWRRFRDAGVRMAGGSDAPVESENPLYGFYAAVTRQDASGHPPGGWLPSQRLTREEALALFTSGAAYAAFEEGVRGRIEAGYAADLTVLAKDPMTVPTAQIRSIPVLLTVVGGRIAYGPMRP